MRSGFPITIFYFSGFQVLMALSFDEDLGKRESSEVDKKSNAKNSKKRKNFVEPKKLPENEKKRSKKEVMSQTREEVLKFFFPV